MEIGTLDVRSPEGHAAHSMQGTDERWVLIQVNTFKNWINDQLRQVDEHVDDLRTDLCDGLKLCHLMEVVLGRRIGRIIKKPLNQHHYLENVNLALRAMTNDGIKLVNIGSEDIVNSNMRLILGMIWRLILKYQISKSKVPPKKLMLSWLNAICPELQIRNFNSDWNDGIALHALIEYCKPGTCPNWKQLSRRDGLANCRAGMQLAKDNFGIPMVVSPENLASPDLDELSGMTYLSYFMKGDSPGYNATLRFVRDTIPTKNVQNFQTDWNDGLVLGSLVTALGGGIQGWPNNVDFSDHEGLVQKGMTAAKTLGVEPVISAHEMADTEVDHLGVMAYAAWFEHLKPRAPVYVEPPAPAPPPVIRVPTPPPPIQAIPPSQQISLVTQQTQASIRQTVQFKLDAQDSDIQKSEVRVEVSGPSSKPPVTLTWQGMTAYGEFTPTQPGTHQIVVYNKGEVVRGAPADIQVSSGIDRVSLMSPIRDTAAGKSQQIMISAEDARRGAVRVEAKAPSGRTHEMAIGESNGVYTANFTPTEVGDWLISILYEGQHIQGSPFNVRVYDAAQVKVFGLEGGAVGKMFSFSVDTAGAGEGALKVHISHDSREVPVQVFHEGRGMYRVNFTPDGGGLYTIRVYFAEMEVTGSPYSLEIVDSSMVTASGEGLSSVEVNRKSTFTVTTGHRGSSGDIRVTVKAPRGQQIPCDVINNGDGTHTIEYTASEVGEYLIDVLYYGKPITGSPFRVQAFDWNRISINNLQPNGTVGKLVEFDIDAQYAGSGNLEIMVNDGTIPCSVQNRGNRQFHATFMPKEAVPHFIQMRFNGREVPGSPWRVDMRSSAHVTVRGAGGAGSTQLVPVNKLTAFEVTTGAYDGNVTANITSPTRRMVSSQVVNNNNGSYMVQYTPTEVGNYQIEISYAGLPVPGSPFSSKAYDTSAIVVSPISSGVTGKAVEFTIDVTQAGEGQLEIMVNRGAVPNTVKMLRKGVFLVTFIPREAKTHLVDIKFNGELYPRCPLNVAVMDASRVTVQGDGIRQVAVNRSSFFKVNTQSAGDADLSVRVTSPSGKKVPARVNGSPGQGFEVDYKPTEVGTYRVDVEFAGELVPGSPFYMKCYDPGRVIVEGIRDSIVAQEAAFIVDVQEAGEGNLEISIMCGGRNIQNHVKQLSKGRFEVSYTPIEGGPHTIIITFNDENVPGSPFAFAVTDATNVTASGDGLGLVPCGKPTSFTVLAPGGRMQDIKVKILGPDGREVYPRLHDNGSGNFLVDWTPRIPGDHKVDVRYRDQPIPGSVFTAKAWDATAVIVSNIRPGRMGKPNYFNVDASRAGAGNLELIVSVSGDNVPNFVKAEGNARFEVSFTPHTADTHMISVKFNGEIVPGSPFYASVVDGSKATASGDGLKNALVGRPAPIVVVTQHVGGEGVERANCVITVTGPSGRQVPVRVTGSPHAGFDAEYTPVEVGRHTVKILYADVDVQGSPFTVNVHDSGNVRVGNIPDGVLNKPVIFEVDASSAGDGTLSVDVQAATSKPYPEVMPLGGGKYQVSFVPHEASPHAISVLFAGAPVTGSPFTCMVYDAASALQVQWGDDGGSGSLVPVRRPVYVTINPKRLPQQPITAQVQDPFNRSMHARVERLPDGIQRIEFTPTEVGGHVVSILYGGQPVPGSPHTSTAYDASRLRIVDVTQDGGAVGQDHGFTVDTTDAGPGEISVEVTNSLGQSVPTTRRQLDTFHQRHTFLPTQHGEHNVHVLFNGDTVPGSPLAMEVANPLRSLSVNGSSHLGIVDQLSHMTISTRGSSSQIDPKLLAVTVSAPNNDLVPAKIVQQPDGDYKVEYSSMYTGRHTVEILYSGQPIMGSPFFVEIYDPNKIRVEGSRSGTVAQMMDFEIIRNEAGKAELGLNITSPSGMPVQYNIVPTRLGDRVTYTPNEPGPYQIYITYGGLEVPGCPITQTIVDSGSMANAYGDGLYKGYEDVPSSFVVDTRNQRGDLTVEVEGPNSMAKCHRQSNGQGQDTVTFTPVEVGEFLVHVKWNGRHIEGSPFRPKVVDPRKLRVIGGWENIVDVNSTFLQLNVNQPKRIEFDSSLAGPGVLSAEARGPDGVLPTQVERLGTSHILTFTPRVAGEHTLALYWSDSPVPRSPLMGVAGGAGGKMNGSLGPVNHEKVVLTGRGLKEASVRQEAEFVIDGMEAGPGAPDVKLTGIKTDIHVQVTPLGEQKYRCVYEPQLPGAYLLNIMWSDRQVRGSPFKVNVIAHSDASKVVCTGDGLKTGILGREIKSLIDTRQAGPGELTAHCMGPGKVAFCELYDHRNGTFQLNVRPQEAGRHVLQIKYGGEHVPGSPYVLKVSGAPDASKVRVSGPGIEHGILATYQSRFICETRGAGAGQLTVRIRGPKGAFRVEMQRESQKDRTILCRYDPTEVGDYIISVKWSGVDVPGSPFHIQIFDTTEELERFMADNPGRRQNAIDFPPRSNGGWAEDL